MQDPAIQNPPQPDASMNPQERRRFLALKEEELRLQRKELELRAQELSLRNKRITAIIGLGIVLCLMTALFAAVGLWVISGKKLPSFSASKTATAPPAQRLPVQTNTSVPAQLFPTQTSIPQPALTATAPPASPTPTPLPVEPTSTPLLVEPTTSFLPFKDNFNAGMSPEWQNVSSEYWGTVNGRLQSLKNYNNDDAVDHAIWIGADDWQNYTVEMDWVSKKYYGDCHLYLAYNPDTRNAALNLILTTQHSDGNNVNLIWSTTPYTVFTNAEMPFKLKVVLQEPLITVYVNDDAISQISLPGYDHGQIGLSCTSMETQLDNFRVTSNK